MEKRRAGTNFICQKNILLPKQLLKKLMSTTSPFKLNTVPFKESMTAILCVKKTDTRPQEMDNCNYSSEINTLLLEKSNA